MEPSNRTVFKQGEVVRIKLKPDLTGVVAGFYYNNKYLGIDFDTDKYSSVTCDVEIIFLGSDLSTFTKRYPVVMIERV
jgi:hypothetical protein